MDSEHNVTLLLNAWGDGEQAQAIWRFAKVWLSHRIQKI